MKFSKLFSAVVIATAMFGTVVNATSIGRAGGGGGSHSSPSVSRPSAPSHVSTPSVAPAPSKPGGIGGTQGSVGVRKSEVTGPVANNVNAGKPGNFNPAPSTVPYSSPAPAYSAPAVPAPSVTNGSTFMSSLGGSFAGTILGNALFGNHGSSTTVVNNGGGGYSGGAPAVVDSGGQVVSQGPVVVQQKESMGMGTIILNVILFAILIAVIVGIALLFYKGYKMLKEYISKERGVSNQPFSPTGRFWEIQHAFAAADVAFLKTLLGPDVVDELTNGLEVSALTLKGVSHEVRLLNNTEFSVWYTFTDNGEQVNQVWHYEKFGNDWLLNGIENV